MVYVETENGWCDKPTLSDQTDAVLCEAMMVPAAYAALNWKHNNAFG